MQGKKFDFTTAGFPVTPCKWWWWGKESSNLSQW